jgi:hypothetical protein
MEMGNLTKNIMQADKLKEKKGYIFFIPPRNSRSA